MDGYSLEKSQSSLEEKMQTYQSTSADITLKTPTSRKRKRLTPAALQVSYYDIAHNRQGKIRKVHSSSDEDKQIKVTELCIVILL